MFVVVPGQAGLDFFRVLKSSDHTKQLHTIDSIVSNSVLNPIDSDFVLTAWKGTL